MVGRLKALLAGFALGIFLAPRSGRASRALLREKIEEFLDLGDERLDALEDELDRSADPRPTPAAAPPIPADPLDAPFPDDPVEEERPLDDAPLDEEPIP